MRISEISNPGTRTNWKIRTCDHFENFGFSKTQARGTIEYQNDRACEHMNIVVFEMRSSRDTSIRKHGACDKLNIRLDWENEINGTRNHRIMKMRK